MPVWTRVADFHPRLRSVEAAEISPDGRTVATASKFGYQVMAFRVADGFLMWEAGHDSEVECVCWSPDSSKIATGGEDYTVRVWDAGTGEELRKIELNAGPDGIAWSADGATVAAGLETGEGRAAERGPTGPSAGRLPGGSTVNSLQFVPGPAVDGTAGEPDRFLAVAGNIQDPAKSGAAAYSGFARKYDLAAPVAGADRPAWEFLAPEGSLKSIRVRARGGRVRGRRVQRGGRRAGLGDRRRGRPHGPGRVGTRRSRSRPPAGFWWPAATARCSTSGGPTTPGSRPRTALPVPRTEYIHFSADGRLMLTAHEDTGLISLSLRDSDLQRKRGLYTTESLKQLDNRDMKPGERGGN